MTESVYVIHDGATLRREGERLVVYARRERKDEIRLEGLRQLVLMGNITLTPRAVGLVVARGVDTVMVSHCAFRPW